jgi:DNA modification methylase
VDKGDKILDPFMGVASLGEWCHYNECNYTGIENDKEVYELAKERMEKLG